MAIDRRPACASPVGLRRLNRRFLPGFVALILLSGIARGQDTTVVVLPEINVTATRSLGSAASVPLSLVSVRRSAAQRSTAPSITLEQTLTNLPGLYIADRNHFAMGERIIIRGMGSRAPFGVRGVQVVLDGIPLTMPDGQAVADIVDPAMITNIQLIRGPASVFWGNGSGGVLTLSTRGRDSDRASRVRIMGGTYGLFQVLGETRATIARHRVHAYASRISRSGYRVHGAGSFTRAGMSARLDLGSGTLLDLTATAALQDAENPGSLTAGQLMDDPRAAAAIYEREDARKESRQVQGSAALLRSLAGGLLGLSVHWIRRDLYNPLPFATIDLKRNAGGAGLSYQREGRRYSIALGADVRFQHDDRQNWNTVDGGRGDRLDLDQEEGVLSASVRGVATMNVMESVRLAVGVRGDRVRFSSEDDFLTNGDQSGHRVFGAVSPMAGISISVRGAELYADYGSAFETPTTTELVNRPDLTGGFNTALKAQRTQGGEAGLRASLDEGRLHADVSAYRFVVRDRLTAFQTVDGGDRTFFRNGGRDVHRGVEVAILWQPVPRAEIRSVVAVGRFEQEDPDARGSRLPGVPEKQVSFSVTVFPGSFRAALDMRRIHSVFADDANTVTADGYALIDGSLSYEHEIAAGAALRPFITVSNLTDRSYVASVTINSSSGRYFDPGSGRTLQLGVNLTF